MKIDLHSINVSKLVKGYEHKGEQVIHTLRNGFPLNTKYWVVQGVQPRQHRELSA